MSKPRNVTNSTGPYWPTIDEVAAKEVSGLVSTVLFMQQGRGPNFCGVNPSWVLSQYHSRFTPKERRSQESPGSITRNLLQLNTMLRCFSLAVSPIPTLRASPVQSTNVGTIRCIGRVRRREDKVAKWMQTFRLPPDNSRLFFEQHLHFNYVETGGCLSPIPSVASMLYSSWRRCFVHLNTTFFPFTFPAVIS